ncbi:MAG: Eco57I restriction-modification methylase domain-containing protein, partial [Gallionella sp.]|nr:Eco57I restriction-modification methylase domain-containing protein [Gallionella sp.]
ETMAEAEHEVAAQPWAQDVQNPWASPLVARIADIRKRIQIAARQGRWAVTEAQLDDRHLVRRMILKRVIFGVDKNLMAVELAKVALWLHTFTVGAPLSFLDHHLRCGDSLFGCKVRNIAQELSKLKGSLLQQGDMGKVESARMSMETIGSLTDIDIAEAHRSKAIMEQINDGLAPLWNTLDFLLAQRWEGKAEAQDYQQAWVGLMAHEYGDNLLESEALLAKPTIKLFSPRQQQAHATVQRALRLAAREHFLHWELAFPTVWQNGQGGFDAIIGNPPWDRMKLQEVEWFAERKPEIAKAARAADRKKLIAQLETSNDSLWQNYLAAQAAAEAGSRVARECGDYPLLSGGDTNLYSLFVDRAQSLIHPRGLVGLLCPSGIAADKGAAEFFRRISTTGRLAVLYDFENKKTFFPDVDSRFKFCALVFGGGQRTVTAARCAFYLHTLEEAADPEHILTLTAQDFSAVNPNTGSAPIFRTRRDADITTAIYRRQPVLALHAVRPEATPAVRAELVEARPSTSSGRTVTQKVWPVRYCTMFHMTNDSGLFKRRDELETQGWYPVGMNHWKKGEAEAVPLYVGRMIYNYDHRSSHVTTNEENLHNAALSANLTAADKALPDRYATPQYWVSESDVPERERRSWAIGFRDIARATDMRTMIAAVVPTVAAGNTLPLVLPELESDAGYAAFAPLLLANFNSFAFDYIARQKAQSTHINWYIVEQLPLIRPEQFEQSCSVGAAPSRDSHAGRAPTKDATLADFVRGEVLHLSYTAHDLTPFARDMGYDGAPFKWGEEDRRHRLARLDALFFNLYGINRDDAAYILDTFPIVREQDEKAHGCYLTKELILAYMNAVTAGDFATVVQT